jgi:hypothetical protein
MTINSATIQKTGRFIQAALDNGVPERLLVPIVPPEAKSFRGDPKSLGKAPAMCNEDGDWVGASSWQRGSYLPELLRQDEHGANVGLICGVPDGPFAYYLFDIDVQLRDDSARSLEIANAICSRTESLLSAALDGAPFWVRKTRSYRSMIAVAVPANCPVGGKQKRTFIHRSGEVFLVVELLGRGQQGVIGGQHVAGPIMWQPYGKPDARSATISLAPDAVPQLKGYDHVVAALDSVCNEMTQLSSAISVKREGNRNTSDPDRHRDDVFEVPRGDAPPGGIDQIVGVLQRMHNGRGVSREVYVDVMLSGVGAIRALERKDHLGYDGYARLREALCQWAVRWGGPTTLENEIDKFEQDFGNVRVLKSGWSTLLQLAKDLTPVLAADFAAEDAHHEFAGIPLPAGSETEFTLDEGEGAKGSVKSKMEFGRLRVLCMDDIVNASEREYIVKGLVSPNEMSIWCGPPKCGKSFLMLYIAYKIAQNARIFGRRVHGCPVLYVAAEGLAGIRKRVRALRAEHGDAPQFYLIPQPINLLDPNADLKYIKDAARHLGAKFIVIDTLARAMAGGDENGPQDMGAFITNVDTLRSDTGAHVAIVHHGTKMSNGGTPRGHGSLSGAADLIIEVSKTEHEGSIAKVTAAKDDADGDSMRFSLRQVQLGKDQDDEPITTCVVDELACPSVSQIIPKRAQMALDCLCKLIADEGEALPTACASSVDQFGVLEDRWREECDDRRILSTADKKPSRSKAFSRAYEYLLEAGRVVARDGLVWTA